ncbi:MAG TPA: DUF6599 family protein [Candidatus Acidoferrales bacterium]|jgi:hypothetical protein|nr:DUF6599 family protein [Candidatus Acidoferrales bacterium]
MHRFISFLFATLLVTSASASAQQILPHSFAGWTQTNEQAFGESNVPSLANSPAGATSAAMEYGFASGERATYGQGPQSLDVTLYRMKDPTGAYGEYSYQRVPGMEPANLAEHSSIMPSRALVLTGNLVVDIQGKNLTANTADLKALVSAVARHAQQGPLPTLWQDLPQKNVVEGTDRYVLGPQTLNQLFPGGLGNSISFSNGAEAEVAHYRIGGHDATLMIVDFPTPQMAVHMLADIKTKYDVNGSQPRASSPPLYAVRSLTLLAVVAGIPSQTEADALLARVQSGAVLTWDEPTFQFKEPSIVMMIVGAIEGTGVICLFALIAGLAFGGLRLVVKRSLPGKIFDRTSYVEVLQLGLGSKPINAEDFYGTPGGISGGRAPDKNLPDRVALRLFR